MFWNKETPEQNEMREKELELLRQEEELHQKEQERIKKEEAKEAERQQKSREKIAKEKEKLEKERIKKEQERAKREAEEEKKRLKEEERKRKEEEKEKIKLEKDQEKERERVRKEQEKKRKEEEKEQNERNKRDMELKVQMDTEKKRNKQNEKNLKLLKSKFYKISSETEFVQKKILETFKIKSEGIEMKGEFYKINKEGMEELKEMMKNECAVSEIYEALVDYSGRNINIMITTGKMHKMFESNRLRNIDSSKWTFFYPVIYDDLGLQAEYRKILSNLYCTKTKTLYFQDGKEKYLRYLEKLDVCMLSGDISLPGGKALAVTTDDSRICCTTEFLRKHCDKTIVVPIDGKVVTNVPGAVKLGDSRLEEKSFWQRLISKVTG